MVSVTKWLRLSREVDECKPPCGEGGGLGGGVGGGGESGRALTGGDQAARGALHPFPHQLSVSIFDLSNLFPFQLSLSIFEVLREAT